MADPENEQRNAEVKPEGTFISGVRIRLDGKPDRRYIQGGNRYQADGQVRTEKTGRPPVPYLASANRPKMSLPKDGGKTLGMRECNVKEAMFATRYGMTGKLIQSVWDAGFSPSHNIDAAKSYGLALLKRPWVVAKIAEVSQEECRRLGVDPHRVLQEWARIGLLNQQDYTRRDPDGTHHIDLDRLDRDQWAAVKRIIADKDGKILDVEFYDKQPALDALSKNLGLFKKSGSEEGGRTINVIVFGQNDPIPVNSRIIEQVTQSLPPADEGSEKDDSDSQ